jgi:hypothetical protein
MNLSGWVPVSVCDAPFARSCGLGEVGAVEWRYLPDQRFTHPFFEDTIRRYSNAPAGRTTMDEAIEWASAHPGLEPAGLIFHMSRCGSTLVSQMLAAVAENRVLAEPVPVDDVIRLGDLAGLRAMISALGQPAAGETRLFIKFDCWHIHSYELIRRAWPETPAIFLYRDPLEVLVSQLRSPGIWAVSGAGVPRAEYVAGLLAGILRSALKHAGTLRLVEYIQLPELVCDLFGMSWSETQCARMRHAARFDAKSPRLEFTPDSAGKRSSAREDARAAASMLVPLYEQLQRATLR